MLTLALVLKLCKYQENALLLKIHCIAYCFESISAYQVVIRVSSKVKVTFSFSLIILNNKLVDFKMTNKSIFVSLSLSGFNYFPEILKIVVYFSFWTRFNQKYMNDLCISCPPFIIYYIHIDCIILFWGFQNFQVFEGVTWKYIYGTVLHVNLILFSSFHLLVEKNTCFFDNT